MFFQSLLHIIVLNFNKLVCCLFYWVELMADIGDIIRHLDSLGAVNQILFAREKFSRR